jgi:hypothetical protein
MRRSSSETKTMKISRPHYNHAVIAFVVSFISGVVLLPLFRAFPESVHTFCRTLTPWVRYCFTVFLATLFSLAIFKLFSPRIGQLRRVFTHPPTWFAFLLAVCALAIADLRIGLSSEGYTPTPKDWLYFGLLPTLLVAGCNGFLTEVFHAVKKGISWVFECSKTSGGDTESKPQIDVVLRLKTWITREDPAVVDYFNHQPIVQRLIDLLDSGTRAIGIIGPFGSGKTSVVQKAISQINLRKSKSQEFLFIQHTCWSFENSTLAIHDLLRSVIGEVTKRVDTFFVHSLPESYRNSFSAGGEWFGTIANLVVGSLDTHEQFERLSYLLVELNLRVVFVVEELDRTTSPSFNIAEVLAFLQRLKRYERLSFLLVGDLNPSKQIDFAKLCDQTIQLKSLDQEEVSKVLSAFAMLCQPGVELTYLTVGDTAKGAVWQPHMRFALSDIEELSPSHAVSRLLPTPRLLRNFIGRTWTAWQSLHGEIDFDQLLALNALRVAAPECFDFLRSNWDRLHQAPRTDRTSEIDRIDRFRKSIRGRWLELCKRCDWDDVAVLTLIEFILPASREWLNEETTSGGFSERTQGLHSERYWRRAVDEFLPSSEERDQIVLQLTRKWVENRGVDAKELVQKLTSSEAFCDTWQALAGPYFLKDPGDILLLSHSVLEEIRTKHGAAACYDHTGFVVMCAFAEQRIPADVRLVAWLKRQIALATDCSLELVNSIWHFWATRRGWLPEEFRVEIRQYVIDDLRTKLIDGEKLLAILGPNSSPAIYQLVFDPGNEARATHNDVGSWDWLGPIMLEALRTNSPLVVGAVGELLVPHSSQSGAVGVNEDALKGFFGHQADEVINMLAMNVLNVPEDRRRLLERVINSSRKILAAKAPRTDARAGTE